MRTDDDLPPPLYSEPVAEEPEPEVFVAPKLPLAGTPSEKGMERLRSAVQNSGGYKPLARHPKKIRIRRKNQDLVLAL